MEAIQRSSGIACILIRQGRAKTAVRLKGGSVKKVQRGVNRGGKVINREEKKWSE
jgi:hypothetical protein